MITRRQADILNRIIKEYIDTAQPVSSHLLEKKYDFGVCPATIRNEMQKLTDKGYLLRLYTSSGRIPTDKGYRFFVDAIFDGGSDFEGDLMRELSARQENEEDEFKMMQSLTRRLASVSHSLVLNYLETDDFFWKEGWEELLLEPEFREEKYVFNFVGFLKNFEENIEDFKNGTGIRIYIGKENKLPKSRDFSIISAPYSLQKEKEGFLALVGPKRMEYEKNISLIDSLIKELDNIY